MTSDNLYLVSKLTCNAEARIDGVVMPSFSLTIACIVPSKNDGMASFIYKWKKYIYIYLKIQITKIMQQIARRYFT